MATSGGQVTSMNGGQWMSRGPESTARGYGKVFDEIAAEYDRHRPAYPDELIDQACRVVGIGRGDAVLEVGCGSGQLTRSLAGRGLRVTALQDGILARHRFLREALMPAEYVGLLGTALFAEGGTMIHTHLTSRSDLVQYLKSR